MLKSIEIAILELDDSHDELFYSQIKILNSKAIVPHLVVNEKLKDRIIGLESSCKIKVFSKQKGFRGRLKAIHEINRYLIENDISKVILNSSHGIFVRDFCLFSSNKYEIIGMLHYVDKLSSSFSQKVISRKVQKYFILNDYLLPHAKCKKKLDLKIFYPIFYQPFTKINTNKKKDEFWISIPGHIEFNKRDYMGFFNAIENLNPNIRFICLGRSDTKDATELKYFLKEKNLIDFCKFFDTYVDWDSFLSYLSDSDLIMPLIHQSTPRYEDYHSKHIAGTFNLSFGLKIPMMIDDSFSYIEDFQTNSIFYTLNNVQQILNDISIQKEKLTRLKQNIFDNPKFSFEYQSQNYLNHILT